MNNLKTDNIYNTLSIYKVSQLGKISQCTLYYRIMYVHLKSHVCVSCTSAMYMVVAFMKKVLIESRELLLMIFTLLKVVNVHSYKGICMYIVIKNMYNVYYRFYRIMYIHYTIGLCTSTGEKL